MAIFRWSVIMLNSTIMLSTISLLSLPAALAQAFVSSTVANSTVAGFEMLKLEPGECRAIEIGEKNVAEEAVYLVYTVASLTNATVCTL
jgi:hypothetical protein